MGTENPQENTSKSNPTASKIDNTLCLSGLYSKNSGFFHLQGEKYQYNSPSRQIKNNSGMIMYLSN